MVVMISILFFQLHLQRNEVIALVNLLNRLSESVDFVHKMAPHVDKIMAAGQGSSSPAGRSVFSIAKNRPNS